MELVKDILAPTSRDGLADILAMKMKLKKELKAQQTELQGEIDELMDQLVLVMDAEHLKNFKDERHGTFYLKTDVYAKTDNEVLLHVWLKNNNIAGLIQHKVNPRQLAALVRERAENGQPDVQGIEVSYKTKVGLRKA